MSVLWINGELVDKNQARVSPFDHGFLFGDGVWEPLRVRNGRLLLIEEHLDSFFRSARRLGLDIPLTRADLIRAIEATLAANHRTDGYVRTIVTRGPGTLGPDPRKLDPQTIVIAEEYRPFPRELGESGLHAVVYPQAIDTDSPLFDARTLGQPHVPLARQYALNRGCLEALLQNRTGDLIGTSEGTLLVVKAGEVVVAAPHAPEATGAYIAAQAAAGGRTVRYGRVRLDDVISADEVCLAGTAAGVVAIVRIHGTAVGPGVEGPVTRSLREELEKLM